MSMPVPCTWRKFLSRKVKLFLVSMCRMRSVRCLTEGLVWLLDLRALARARARDKLGRVGYLMFNAL